jgi:hypothetical protein
MLNCPACKHGVPKEWMRRVMFDCPNWGIALRTRPNAVTVWCDRLNRFSWWALIVLFLIDRAWLGRNLWMVLVVGGGIAVCGDVLAALFPAAGFEVVAPALPARYRNLAPVSNREYNQRWKTVKSLRIT